MKHFVVLMSVLAICVSLYSCKKDNPVDNTVTYGKISFDFSHKVSGNPLAVDTFLYTNAAGNVYQISEIQYFISDIKLKKADGSEVLITEDNGIHYIDTDIPTTWQWGVSQDIPTGDYSSVSFTFGINQAKNISNMFLNPPENNMFWPEYLGGGYHYMKLNGEWIDTASIARMFNFHLGIGQVYAGGVIVVDSITGFVQNYFEVNLPSSSFTITKDATKEFEIVMNVESWFDTPHIWDFNDWGTNIMQNQAAMQTAKENGYDVFSCIVH